MEEDIKELHLCTESCCVFHFTQIASYFVIVKWGVPNSDQEHCEPG